MADPTKQFSHAKTVRMKAPLARAIEDEAKQLGISEGAVMRDWLRRGRFGSALDVEKAPLKVHRS